MRLLPQKLAAWVEQGLITSDQASAIRAYEERLPQRHWAILAIAGIGIVAFVTGVISLIAANWEIISATSKIITYFLIQTGLAIIFVAFRNHAGLPREAPLTLFALMFLAGIGVVSQIFNLRGDGWEALLFWAMLTAPSVWISQSRLLPHLWLAGITAAQLQWTFASDGGALALFDRGVALLSFWLVAWSLGVFRHPVSLPTPLRHATLSWAVVALLGVGSFVANVLWYETPLPEPLSLERRLLLLAPWAACGIAAASLTLSRPPHGKWFRASALTMVFLLCLFTSIPLLFPVGSQKVVGCLGFQLVWAAAAAAAAFSRHRRLFDVATLVIALRFVVVYLEVFGSLTTTGLGLMACGLVILSLAIVWYRYRRPVETWLETKA